MKEWGIWCIRSPRSFLGYGASWAKDGTTESGLREYDTEAEAEAQAKAWNEQQVSGNVTYFAKRFGDE